MSLPSRHKFSADDVLQMVEHGILREGAHVELFEGDLIEMPPQGPEHSALVEALNDTLRVAYPVADFRVRPALPLIMSSDPTSLPEPDFAVVPRSQEINSVKRHPRSDEAILVIEIAKSSLALDHRKAVKYARSGVPEYWVIDVKNRQVHRYSCPTDNDYTEHEILSFTAILSLPAVQGQQVRLSDLRWE